MEGFAHFHFRASHLLILRLCRSELGVVFLGLANFRKIAHKFLSNFFGKLFRLILRPCFARASGPQKPTPKIVGIPLPPDLRKQKHVFTAQCSFVYPYLNYLRASDSWCHCCFRVGDPYEYSEALSLPSVYFNREFPCMYIYIIFIMHLYIWLLFLLLLSCATGFATTGSTGSQAIELSTAGGPLSEHNA